MADALEPTAAGGDVRFEHPLRGDAKRQVDMPDQSGAGPDLAIGAAGGHGCDTVHKFGFADAPVGGRSVRTIHRPALNVHGSDDPVTRGEVDQELIEKIARGLPDDGLKGMTRRRQNRQEVTSIPKMVVRVDDDLVRIQNRFGTG